jgi:hypothetical protein
VRSAESELQLQGLRTALSLALGDRPAAVYLLEGGSSVLSAPAGSEASSCLLALKDAGIPLMAEADGASTDAQWPRATRIELLDAIALAAFQQTF